MDIDAAIKEFKDSTLQVQKMHELVRLRLELIRRNSVSEKQDLQNIYHIAQIKHVSTTPYE